MLTLFTAAAALNATAATDAATAANSTAAAGQGKKGKKAGKNAKGQDVAAEQALQADAQHGSLLDSIPGAADLLSGLGLKRRNRQAFRRSINLQNYEAIAV